MRNDKLILCFNNYRVEVFCQTEEASYYALIFLKLEGNGHV